jgi:hypothetical protein
MLLQTAKTALFSANMGGKPAFEKASSSSPVSIPILASHIYHLLPLQQQPLPEKPVD